MPGAKRPFPLQSVPSTMRVALVHDWFPAFRGGERVVSSLLGLFPDADVFTLFDFLSDAERDAHFGGKKFIVSPMNSWPFARHTYRHLFFLCPFFIEQFNVVEHDGVISSSAAFARGVIARPDQPHLCYVHSPIRYAWDQQFEYLEQGRLRFGPKGLLFRWMLHRLRIWDVRTASGPDLMVANSTYVRERIRRIYGRDAEVIHPPVEVDSMPFCDHKDEYYVVASFLAPYKRIDLIVRAFNAMPNRRLLVVGEGQQARELKAMAGPNVHFTGYLPRAAFLDAIAKAKAFVFAGCEDFGIVMAETQACGTPLIAFSRGGARDIVRTPEEDAAPTGLLFNRQTPEAIMEAVEAFEVGAVGIAPEVCRDNALRFSEARFHREFADAWGRAVEVNKRGFLQPLS
jgi:glycosyltransferase involved in cell wall biosynthesis